jgi:nitrous oxidase accessory protein NosD
MIYKHTEAIKPTCVIRDNKQVVNTYNSSDICSNNAVVVKQGKTASFYFSISVDKMSDNPFLPD